MVGWHHCFNEHELVQTPGGGEGQGNLVCCSHGVTKSWTTWWTEQQRTYCHQKLQTQTLSRSPTVENLRFFFYIFAIIINKIVTKICA